VAAVAAGLDQELREQDASSGSAIDIDEWPRRLARMDQAEEHRMASLHRSAKRLVTAAREEQVCQAADAPANARPRPRFLATPVAVSPPVKAPAQSIRLHSDDLGPSWHAAFNAPPSSRPPREKETVGLVDDRGLSGVGRRVAPLFLQVQLANWDPKAKVMGPLGGNWLVGSIDNGSPVSICNPHHVPEPFRSQMVWVKSDRVLVSLTNHPVHGAGVALMTWLVVAQTDMDSGELFYVATKFYASTTLGEALLFGRALIEDKELGRCTDNTNSCQRFGREGASHRAAYVAPPVSVPRKQMVSLICIGETMVAPGQHALVPCATGAVERMDEHGVVGVVSAVVGGKWTADAVHPHPAFACRIVLDGRFERILIKNPSDQMHIYSPGAIVSMAYIIEPSDPEAVHSVQENPQDTGGDDDPFGVGDVTDEEVVEAMMLAVEEQLFDVNPQIERENFDYGSVFAGLATPQRDESEFIRETRKSFTAHLIKQRMATPVNLVSVERTGSAGLQMSGGQVECESSEDTAHMKENVWDHGDPDYESIQFAEEQLLVAIPDARERERAKQMIRTLLRKHHDRAKAAWLASGKTSGAPLFGGDPGSMRNMPPELSEFKIRIIPGSKPQRQGLRRFSEIETIEIKRQITKMLRASVISACHSLWAAGVVLTRKKDLTWRFACDLRKLNAVTELGGNDVFPLPRMDEVLRRCSGKHWFSGVDGTAAFWGIKVEQASQQYTAFTCPVGQFSWARLPMGARQAPAFFQRCIEWVCRPHSQEPGIQVALDSDSEAWVAYLDDLTVCTTGSWLEHVQSLDRFMERLVFHGFTLNLQKCVFLRTSMKLLGHVVGREGISASPDYVQKIKDFTDFTTVRDVQAFLGLASFYRTFIRNFAQRSSAMRGSIEVCKEAGREKLGAAWSPECEAERLDLIAALTSSNEGPLVPPDFSKPFRIAVDAGMLPGGVGVVLEQVQPNGSVRPVGFASKALTKVQMRWATSQIEAYAIVFGLRTFRWALNPAFPHTIVSDHRALKWLKDVSKEETAGNRQLKRFACEVENYGPYLFEFRAGALNGAADGLSRVVSTDRTIDGRRDREESASNDLSSPSPNLWEEVDSVTEAYFQTVLEEAVPLCRADPEWAPWLADVEQLESIEHELRRQLRERRLVERTFLSREQVARVEAVLDQTQLLSQ
jgi:hypothetical protein